MNVHEALANAFLGMHAEAAARLLESLPVEQSSAVLRTVATPTAAAVLGHMLPTAAARCIEQQQPADSARMLERLGSQDAVAVLRHLPRDAREAVMSSLGAQWLVAAKLLLRYPPSTVGAWIEPRVLTLPDDCTVGEARDRIARNDQVAQARVYVLDRSRRIRGAVRGLTLIKMPNRKSVTAILEPAPAIWAREPLATAQEHAVWERDTEAPVINGNEEFIGIVTYADLRRAYRQQRTAADANANPELAEVSELLAISAGSVWQSLGDLVRGGRRR